MANHRTLTDVVLAKLRESSRPIGDGIAPDNQSLPYATLFPLDVVSKDGDYRDVEVTGWHEWQITSVGETREQAQALADELRGRITSARLTPGGIYSIWPWQLSIEGILERDDDVKPPLFYVIDVVQGFVSPL